MVCFFVSFPCFKNEASSLLNKAFEKSDCIMHRVHCFPYLVIFSLTLKKPVTMLHIYARFALCPLCLSVYLSVCLYVHPSIIYLSIHPFSIHPFIIYLSIHYPSIFYLYLSIYLSIYLSSVYLIFPVTCPLSSFSSS